MIDKKYQDILTKCKFISKPDGWFVEGTEAKLLDRSYYEYIQGDKFDEGWSLFSGYTNETYTGYSGELPRLDEDTCTFTEFLIYDEFNNEISQLTLEEYEYLIRTDDRNKKLNRIIK